MPKLQRKPRNCIKGVQLKNIQAGLIDPKHGDGVMYKDGLRGSGTPQDPVYGDNEEVENVYKKYVENSLPEHVLPYVFVTENGLGTMIGLKEPEKSCSYLTLSKSIWGNVKYYWRLRMVAAHCILQCSFLREEHALLQETSWFHHVIGEILELDDDQNTVSHNSDNYERTIPITKRMKTYARQVISGSSDSGQIELLFINRFFDACIYAIGCRT
jgi:hypothetical protein